MSTDRSAPADGTERRTPADGGVPIPGGRERAHGGQVPSPAACAGGSHPWAWSMAAPWYGRWKVRCARTGCEAHRIVTAEDVLLGSIAEAD